MKGYDTAWGYKGYIPSLDMYILFATEQDYIEYFRAETEKEDNNGI